MLVLSTNFVLFGSVEDIIGFIAKNTIGDFEIIVFVYAKLVSINWL